MAVCALAVLTAGFCVYALASPAHLADFLSVLVPKSFVVLALGFATALVVVTSLGICGARTRNRCALSLYVLVVTAAFVVEMMVAMYILVQHGYLREARAAAPGNYVDAAHGTVATHLSSVEAGLLALGDSPHTR